MSVTQVEFGFVAALEREVSGIVRSWDRTDLRIAAASRRIYSTKQAALICAGTGISQAYTATKVLIENCAPKVIISIGFVGSCVNELPPGSVVVPASVLELGTGRTFASAFGSGRLVTLDRVAGKAMKQFALAQHNALAVDMEAAGVAKAAFECKRQFAAVKTVSDGADEDLEILSAFVRPEGFATGRFVAHIALRPRLWPAVAALNRNSQLASRALAGAVGELIGDWRSFQALHSPSAAQVRLEESC